MSEQIKTFLEIMNGKSVVAKIQAARDYTKLWEDQPELLEQYLTCDKILSYLK